MEKICPYCGAPMPENSKFCTECGKPLPASQPKPEPKKEEPPKTEQVPANPAKPIGTYDPATGTFTQPNQPKPIGQPNGGTYIPAADVPGPDSPYQPVSARGWYGVMWLLRLPIIGLLISIVWACGGCRKIDKRNYCRAMLIDVGITLVLLAIIGGIGYSVLKKVFDDPATQSALEGLISGFTEM